jgi:hypothetical protein
MKFSLPRLPSPLNGSRVDWALVKLKHQRLTNVMGEFLAAEDHWSLILLVEQGR